MVLKHLALAITSLLAVSLIVCPTVSVEAQGLKPLTDLISVLRQVMVDNPEIFGSFTQDVIFCSMLGCVTGSICPIIGNILGAIIGAIVGAPASVCLGLLRWCGLDAFSGSAQPPQEPQPTQEPPAYQIVIVPVSKPAS